MLIVSEGILHPGIDETILSLPGIFGGLFFLLLDGWYVDWYHCGRVVVLTVGESIIWFLNDMFGIDVCNLFKKKKQLQSEHLI